MPKQYTQFPREVQIWRAPRIPVYSTEEAAHLKMLAREYYGLTGDEVQRFVRLTALLDYYAEIIDVIGSLDERQQRAQEFALRRYAILTNSKRLSRAA